MSNIWHDISPKRISPTDFVAVVEISKGSKKKYELDKETGLIILIVCSTPPLIIPQTMALSPVPTETTLIRSTFWFSVPSRWSL